MTFEAEQAWRAIYRAYTRMAPTIDKELKKSIGLTYSEYEALLQLNAAAAPVKMSDLASQVAVTRTHASRLFASLEVAGLAKREPNPYDDRSVLVSITSGGAQRLQESASVVDSVFAERVGSDMSASDLRQLTSSISQAFARES